MQISDMNLAFVESDSILDPMTPHSSMFRARVRVRVRVILTRILIGTTHGTRAMECKSSGTIRNTVMDSTLV